MSAVKQESQLGQQPVEVLSHLSPELFEEERERIFKQVWLKVACDNEIPNPGDYKVKRLDVARTSIILVRGEDNNVRAFHNICTHRGNKIIPETSSDAMGETFGHLRANIMTCRFHGWVFSTDGNLRSVPDEKGFSGLDKSCLGLRSVHCDTWEGFIYIHLDEDPKQSLTEYLGEIGRHFSGYPYSEATCAYRYSTILRCNWKIALFAFAESYHVPTIHANTIPNFAKFDHRDFRLFGPHSTSALHAEIYGMSGSPASDVFGGLLKQSPVHGPRPQDLPKDVNPKREDTFQFEFPVFFPNFQIDLCAGYAYPGLAYFTHQFWPLSVDETLWEGINYFRPPRTPGEELAQIHINALHRNAWLEDTGTMENTHEALSSGILDKIQLMDRELMIRNTDHHWRHYMGMSEQVAK